MSRGISALSLLFLAAGLLLALYSLSLRTASDNTYKDVIVLIDWEGLRTLPPGGAPPVPDATADGGALPAGFASRLQWELVSEIPGASLCYGEETIGSLLEQGIIRSSISTNGGPAYEIVATQYGEDIVMGLLRHGYTINRGGGTGGRLSFEVPALPQEELSLLPVAWLGEVLEAARARSIPVVLRPGGTEFYSEGGLADTFDFAGRQPIMLFQGPIVPGYPSGLDQTADLMKANGQSFVWVEFDEQDGGGGLATRMKPDVVRLHSIPAEEMVNYDIVGAVDRMRRALDERSIRCLYVRPFIRGKLLSKSSELPAGGYGARLSQVNRDYLRELQASLADGGYRVADKVAPPQDKPAWLKPLLQLSFVLAKGGAFLLLLALWFPLWPRWAWNALLALVIGKALLSVAVPQLNVFFLIETAVVFPLLGTWLALLLYQRLTLRLACPPVCGRRLLIALGALAVASVVSIAGGLLIHSLLWSTDMMLKIGQFRGVTLALALPLLFIAGYSWHAETLGKAYDPQARRLEGYWPRMLSVWNAPIRYGDVAFIMIVLGAVAIVLLRSGNESPLEVLSVESWFRGSLEEMFGLRPRTKELIGHPFFILFLLSLAWRSRLAILFGLAGVLAQASMVNTFCHLHTPFMMSLERSLLGLGLGALTGLIWGSVAMALYWVWQQVRPLLLGEKPAGDG